MGRDRCTSAFFAVASFFAIGVVDAAKSIRGYAAHHARSLQTAETRSMNLGCFRDSQDDRRFELGISGPDNSQQFCYDYCERKGSYMYYGLQYGSECWCGVAGADYDGLGALPQDSCRQSCSGIPGKDCGGRNAMQVFEYIRGEPKPALASGECYADVKRDRILPDKNTMRDITIEGCKDLCSKDPSNAYYGLQYGVECWCGPASSDISRHGESDLCNMMCGGDDKEFCGGDDAMNVYSIAPINDGDLGCYADVKMDRILGDKTRDRAMTPARCKVICEADPVNAFYGVQFANECWCGPASSDYTKHGESDQCTMRCAGDDKLICGGYDAMNMYTLRKDECSGEHEKCERQSDCCDEFICRGTPDLVKVCQKPLEPTPAPVDSCAEEREECEFQSDCCDDLVCSGTPELIKLCQRPAMEPESRRTPVPAPAPRDDCKRAGYVCIDNSDCCTDLTCRGGAGGGEKTCQ